MASFRGLSDANSSFAVSGCSGEDFNLSKLASTTVSDHRKAWRVKLVKLERKLGYERSKSEIDPAPLPIYATEIPSYTLPMERSCKSKL